MDVTLAFWSLLVLASASGGLYYMKRVSQSDPGFVTASILSSIRRGARPSSAAHDVDERLNHSELWAGNWDQLCVTCKFVKPFGTKHCATRDKCVARFDHYCPWMGNTIGKRNHRDFVIFLILESFAMAVAFCVAIARFNEESPTERLRSTAGITCFAALDALTLLPVAHAHRRPAQSSRPERHHQRALQRPSLQPTSNPPTVRSPIRLTAARTRATSARFSSPARRSLSSTTSPRAASPSARTSAIP